MAQRRAGVPLHQVYVSEAFKLAIDELADRNRRPPTEEIRIALERHLAANGAEMKAAPEPLPKPGRPRKPAPPADAPKPRRKRP